MIKYLLIAIAVLVGIYYFYNIQQEKTENYIQEPLVSERQAPFISSDKFAGKKEGYVFKMDSEGLGYYLDRYQ